jgi:hypothetical protein
MRLRSFRAWSPIDVTALWIRMRRLGASMMLVAALAFAFHSGVVAASEFGPAAPVGQVAAHDHGQAANHDRATDHHDGPRASAAAGTHVAGDHGDHDHGKGHCKTNCCGAACTTAVLSTPAFHVSRVEISSVLIGLFVPVLSGIDPSALKRPPRTPSIA